MQLLSAVRSAANDNVLNLGGRKTRLSVKSLNFAEGERRAAAVAPRGNK